MASEKTDGISYQIEIGGQLEPLKQFNAEAEKLIESLRTLKKELAEGAGGGRPGRSTGGGGDSGGRGQSASKEEAANLSAVERELRRIAAARELMADAAVRDARKLLAIDREILSLQQSIARGRNADIQARRLQASTESELLRNEIERQKLENRKIVLSRQDLAIRKQNASLETQQAKAADKGLQQEIRITESKTRQAKIARDIQSLSDRQLQNAKDRASVFSRIENLQRKERTISNSDLRNQQRITKELERQAQIEDKLAAIKGKEVTRDLEAELKVQEGIERIAIRKLEAEKKLEEARRRTAGGASVPQAVASVGLSAKELSDLKVSSETLGPVLEKNQSFAQRLREQFSRLKGTVEELSGANAGLFFTFRRLVGILAIFTLARKAAQGLSNLVRQTINFNKELEQIQLGVASVVVAAGQVFDSLGNRMQQGAEALSKAIPESRRQLEQLRLDALVTAATFSELAEAFQVGIAPGLQAGLDLDQIRRFSVRISQAASAIGLAQNQLAEEIRSILAGTISIRTTRIAAALGITNEDIRRAKEMGKLAEFLDEKFGSFAAAGEESLKNLATIQANLRDGIMLLLGTGSIEFFEELKILFSSLMNDIRTINEETGEVELNKELLVIVEGFSAGLASALRSFQKFRSSLTSSDIAPIFQGLSAVVQVFAAGLAGLATGFAKGFSDAANAATILSGALSSIFGTDLEATAQKIQTIVASFARLAAIIVSVKAVLFGVNGILAGIGFVSSGLLKTWTAIRTVVLTMRLLALGQLAAVAGIVPLLAKALLLVKGISIGAVLVAAKLAIVPIVVTAIIAALGYMIVKIIDNWDALSIRIVATAKVLALQFTAAFASMWNAVKKLAMDGARFVVDSTLKMVEISLSAIARVSSVARKALEGVRKARESVSAMFDEKAQKQADEYSQKMSEIRQQLFGIVREAEAAANASEEGDLFGSIVGFFKDGFDKTKKFADRMLGTAKTVGNLGDRLAELPSQIGSASSAAADLENSFSEVQQSVRKIYSDIAILNVQMGLTGAARDTARISAEAEVEAAERLRDLQTETLEIEARRSNILQKQEKVTASFRSLSEEELHFAVRVVQANQKRVDADIRASRTASQLAIARIALQDASRKGEKEGLEEAKQRLEVLKQQLEEEQAAIKQAYEAAKDLGKEGDERFENAEMLVSLAIEEQTIKGELAKVEAELADRTEARLGFESQLFEIELAKYRLRRAEIADERSRVRADPGSLDERSRSIQDNAFLTDNQKLAETSALYNQVMLDSEAISRATEEGTLLLEQRLAVIEQEQQALLDMGEPRSLALEQEGQAVQLAAESLRIAQEHVALEAERAAAAQEKQAEQGDPNSLADQYLLRLIEIENSTATTAQNLASVIGSAFSGMHQGLVNGIRKYAQETGNIMDVVKGLGVGVYEALTNALAQYVADWIAKQILMMAIGEAQSKARIATTATEATATAAVWTPAAIMASIGSFGAAALIGLAAVLAATAMFHKGGYGGDQVQGFKSGGSPVWSQQRRRSGAGKPPRHIHPKDKIPGWFRPQEFIMRPEAVRAWGTDAMYAINDLTVSPGDVLGLAEVLANGSRISQARNSMAEAGPEKGFFAGGSAAAGSFPSSVSSGDFSGEEDFSEGRMVILLAETQEDAMAARRNHPGPVDIVKVVRSQIERYRR